MTNLTWIPGNSTTTGHFEEKPVQPEKTVRFTNTVCKIERHRYMNGRAAITLTDEETGEPVATASVNLVDQDLAPDEVAVNHDHPQLGPLLVEAGILEPAHRSIESRWVTWQVHKRVE